MIVKLAIGLPLGSALRSATKGLSQAMKGRGLGVGSAAPRASGAQTGAAAFKGAPAGFPPRGATGAIPTGAIPTGAIPTAGVGGAAGATSGAGLLGAAQKLMRPLQATFMGTALGGAGLSAYQTAQGMYDYSSGQLDGAGDMFARAADAFRQMPAWQRLGLAIAPETAMDSKAVHRAIAEKITGAPDWKTRWFGPVVYGRAMEGIKRLRAGQPLAGLPDSNTLFGQTAEMYDKKHLNDLVGLYEKLKATTAPSS